MDGVLIDSEPFHIKTNKKLFKEYGIDYLPKDAHKFFGLGIKEFYQKISKVYKKEVPFKEAYAKDKKMMAISYKSLIPLNHQAKEALTTLQTVYKMALATSTPKVLAESALKRLKLIKLFGVLVFGDEVENGKPNPEIYLKTARKLDLSPNECIVVEDSINGMKAARNAGMKVIAYKAKHNNYQDFSVADFVIEDLREIPKILKELNQEGSRVEKSAPK